MNETRTSTTRDNLMKEYATDEIVVEWDPRLCYHSQNCVRALPQVFDDSRRLWVKVDAATADEVETAVARCPSGALRFIAHYIERHPEYEQLVASGYRDR